MKNPNKTILFIEDDPLILAIYRNRLQREGFHVEVVSDGLAALEKLPSLKPGLVILDLMLPMLDGLDILKFIREDSDLKATPVLILSNTYMDDQAAKALKAGASKGLLKTQCTPAKLMEVINELLGITPENAATNNQTDSALAKADEASLKKTRDELIKDAPTEIGKIREHCLAYVKAGGSPESNSNLNELYQHVRFFCARAGLSNCTKITHLASALEAMLFEIIFKSATPSQSALQTLAQSVDCLGQLFDRGDTESSEVTLKAKVLVVDDDPICTFATVSALKRAKLEAASTQDPVASLKMAQADVYDIVLLDINMPELNGFEVCEQLRALPSYKKTPVIFVTSNGDFQSKAQSVLSGGNDLITKPISPLELTLKTVIHLIEPNGRSVHSQRPAKTQAAPTSVIPAPLPKPAENGNSHAHAKNGESKIEAQPHTNGKSLNGHGAPTRFSAPQRSAPPLPAAKMKPATLQFSAPKLSTAKTLSVNRINPPSNGINHEIFMKNPTESLDKLAVEVARIIFGDDTVTDMNMRLTRIALERYNVPEIISGGAKPESLDHVSREVSRIIFGDENVSEMNVRLTRIALERYNVHEIIGHSPEANGRNGSHAETPGVVVNL